MPEPRKGARTESVAIGHAPSPGDCETAWDAVREALPARWQLGPPTYDPDRQLWQVTARGPHPGRGKYPEIVAGGGEDETAALRDLDDRIRGVPRPDGGRMDALRRRLRLAYIQGAEEWSQRRLGRALSSEELGGVVERFDL